MSDDDTRDAPNASTATSNPPTRSRSGSSSATGGTEAPGAGPAADTSAGEGSAASNGDGDRAGRPAGSGSRRRRRGSRGGRGRRGGQAKAQGDAAGTGSDRSARSQAGGDDYHDAAADRGYTADDTAGKAMEEAGIEPPDASQPRVGDTRPAPKPRIGDSRPAPPAGATEAAPKRRRRRRGGRGRRGGGGGEQRRPDAGGYVDAGTDLGLTDVDGTAILESLDEETLERRRGLTRKGRPAGRYLMVVHVQPSGTAQIAVLEGRALVEHYVSRPEDDETSIDGNIYLGRVQNVLPGMEAAFVDIGTPKNGVLYRSDVVFDPSDLDGNERPKIERMLKNGQTIIVQVTKNPIGHKGARLTQEVSLAGRFVVMVPNEPQTYGISKRLPDDERKRLRRILDHLRPDDAGLIVRTAAEGATEEELELDLRRLRGQWEQISALAARSTRGRAGSLLYKEPPLAVRVIREEFTKEYRGVVIDDRTLYEEVHAYVEAIAPELADRVEHYDSEGENLPVFEKFHVHEQLHKALDRKVWLPSGGSLIIERTEALTVIDVNTGRNVGRSNLEETVFQNNLEAAEAVARELRLRDIGGIIVIDFIDMEVKKNREAVEEAFREALARDKTRTQVFGISELGLVEMTRKRVSEGLVEAFSETCAACGGRGFVVDESLLE